MRTGEPVIEPLYALSLSFFFFLYLLSYSFLASFIFITHLLLPSLSIAHNHGGSVLSLSEHLTNAGHNA